MALLGAGVRAGAGPMRMLAAPLAGAVERAWWGQTGAMLNLHAGQATVISGASQSDTAARPNGYEPPGSWCMAIKGGGLACTKGIEGAGSLASGLTMGGGIEAALSGSGTISAAAMQLVVQLAAALAGSGTISAAALQAISSLTAALSGSGTISAAQLSLIVSMLASLSGSGGASGTLRGTASLAADIAVSGELTAGQVASAVWAEALESGFTADRILRIIAASAAGKSSGGPGDPVFRNLADTQDQITGTADSNGDRSAATYGA